MEQRGAEESKGGQNWSKGGVKGSNEEQRRGKSGAKAGQKRGKSGASPPRETSTRKQQQQKQQ